MCIKDNCKKKARFNFKGEIKLLYCSEHKKDNMINLDRKLCEFNNCYIRANYNILNENKGKYCNLHKSDDMIDVINRKCLEENCKTQPFYNLPNKTNGIYCGLHKKDGMIDIKNKKCQQENCNVLPSYNLITESIPIYCAIHKSNNMVDIKTRKCKEFNCNIIAAFNYTNKKSGIYCCKHKKENMINIKNKICIDCDTSASNIKYKGYCLRCFIFKFPNEKISKNYKVKENHMTDFIKTEFKNEVMIFDKKVGGCSLRRPDCYIDKFTHIVIIECDENQHRDTSCENKRTMELFQDFGNRPIIFIRFNPDKYITKNQKIPSSFKMHKSLDVPVVRDKIEWNNRLQLLKTFINKWLNEIPIKEVTNEYLFYDER
jgi:hypothetical protein